jgi:hypothetical protein
MPMSKNKQQIEYFKFEEDFVDDNIRCIPMIVRYKLDTVGIKLKLDHWVKLSVEEKYQLATKPTSNDADAKAYFSYLYSIIHIRFSDMPTLIESSHLEQCKITNQIPLILQQQLANIDYSIELAQWQNLKVLQRFALIKLASSSHEHKNLKHALKEFKLI